MSTSRIRKRAVAYLFAANRFWMQELCTHLSRAEYSAQWRYREGIELFVQVTHKQVKSHHNCRVEFNREKDGCMSVYIPIQPTNQPTRHAMRCRQDEVKFNTGEL